MMEMTVQGLDYESLMSNATVKQGVVTAITDAVVAQAGGSIADEHVSVELSEGSVAAAATITPPAHVETATLMTDMSASIANSSITAAIASNVQSVAGISNVTTGSISAVVDEPKIVTAVPTVVPTSGPTATPTPRPTPWPTERLRDGVQFGTPGFSEEETSGSNLPRSSWLTVITFVCLEILVLSAQA